MKDKLKYVVDSAIFKQERYTPVTHLKIVSPNKLRTNPPEAVIIIASAYSKEVLDNLKNDYPEIMNIAILHSNFLEIY